MAMRKNLSIMGIASLITFVLNFASVLIVSRILTPMEIGVFSVSVAVLGMAHIIREFGVGNYLIQTTKVDSSQFRAAFSIALYSSWFIAIGLFLLRVPLSSLYDHKGIAEILAILSINFVILPFGTPLLSLMRREQQFNKLAWLMVLDAFVQSTVTVGCVLAGESYLSMAWGSLVALVIKIILLNFMRPGVIFMLPTIRGLGEVFRFGFVSSLASIVKEVGSSAPDLILGRSLGFVEVAFFSRAAGLKRMIIDQLINFVRGVYFPSFASNLRDGGDGAKLYSQTMLYVVSITAPVLAVLAILAEPLIIFMFGEQWERSALIATMVCLYSILTTPYSLYGISLIAAGKVNLSLKAEVAIQSIQILVLLSSFWLELEQVVILLVLAFFAEALFSQIALKRAFGLGFIELFHEIKSSLVLILLSAVGPALIVYLSHTYEFTEFRFVILISSGILACIGWLSGVFITNHVMKSEIVNIWNKLINVFKNNLAFKKYII